MALLVYEGFDNWSASFLSSINLSGVAGVSGLGVWGATSLSVSASASYGGKALNSGNSASWSYNIVAVSTNALICGFRWNSSDLTANVLTIYDSAFAVQCGLGISAGKLFMWRGTTSTVLGTGTTTILASRDNFIEIKTQLSNSANVTVRLNGITEFTLSGVDTTNTANQNWQYIGCSTTPVASVVLFDDLYLLDDTGPAPLNDLLGQVHVDTSFGTSATRTQFTPLASTNVSQIQETAVDGDTTYNFGSNTGGAVDLFNHVSFPPATAVVSTPQTIFCAKVQSFARKDDVPPILYRNKLVSSTGLITNGAVRGSGGLTTLYQLQEDYYTTDPATGLAWTAAGVNGSQIGYEILRSSLLYFLGAGSLTVDSIVPLHANAFFNGAGNLTFSFLAPPTTWNPGDKNANVTLSNGNLTATQTSGAITAHCLRSQNPQTNGKYYIEINIDNVTGAGSYSPIGIGLANSTFSLADGNYLGIDNNSIANYTNNGNLILNNVVPIPNSSSAFGTGNGVQATVVNQKVSMMIDIDNAVCYLNNVTSHSTTQGFKPMALSTLGTSGIMVGAYLDTTNAAITANFGATAFTGTVPTAEFGSGWGSTTPTPPTCRWSAARSSQYCRITGATDNVVDHTTQDNWHRAATTIYHNTGKYYCEFDITQAGTSGSWMMGVSAPWGYLNSFGADIDNSGIMWNANGGVVTKNNATVTTIQTATTGDTACMAVDFDNKKIWWRKNGGNWNNDVIGNQNPATNTGGVDITTIMNSNVMFGPCWAGLSQNGTGTGALCTARFGQAGFSFTAPSGFSGWA